MKRFHVRSIVVGLLGALIASPGTAAAASVFVGLGDSITFGETDLRYVPSDGDQGYVSKVADMMAAKNGGVRPQVVNLAIDGETAGSFMSGSGRTPPVMGRTDLPLAQQNTNYANSPTTPQAQMFSKLVASENAAGNSITGISITLGFNEVAALANLSTSQALAMLPQTLATYRTNYTNVLTQIRSLEPNAQLFMVGYYNPFPADPTNNPAKPIFAQAGPELNGIIEGLSHQFDASFINTNAVFLGHEAALTYISQYPAGSTSPAPGSGIEPIGNVHPNDAGYTAIANQFAAVPEPSTCGLFGVSAAAMLILTRRFRRNRV